MLKKQLFINVLFTLLPFCAMADNVKIDELYYKTNPDDYTACVINGFFVDGVNKYTGDIIIPETIEYKGNTYTVNSIQKGAYSDGNSPYYGGPFDCSNITSIIIPKTITQIDEYTFKLCKKLKTVTFCGDINEIGNGAFAYCELLANIILPNGLVSIGDEAFSNCSSLISVTIPNTVTSIGGSAFSGCSGLTSVTVQCSPRSLFPFLGCSNLKEVTFDCETVTSLFAETSIEKVTMNEGVTSIGDGAFSGCSGLTTVDIPNSVTSIGDGTFRGCMYLTSVTISPNIQKIGDGVFDGCISLESLIIPPSVSSIGYFAFRDCNSLKSLIIETEKAPYCVNESFGDWTENATLHVKDYAVETFKGVEPWNNFKEIIVDEKVTDFNLVYIIDDVEYKVVKYKYDDEIIPEEYPVKEGYSFSGWDGLPKNMPGKEVKVYGKYVRNEIKENSVIYWALNEKALVIGNDNASGDVNIAEKVKYNEKELPVTEVISNAFKGCKDVSTIELPATITNIGERTFAGIDKLTDVIIYAENVPETERTAFESSYIDYVTLHVPYCSVDKYKSVGPWKDFKEIVAIEGTEPVTVETCAMPTISFLDGKLEFESETYGAECHYEIKVEDAKEGVGPEVTLSSAYEISAYASKEGYNDSEKNTATLYWINVDPTTTGVIDSEMRINTNSILVQNTGGVIAISGLADGDNVLIYNISGQLIAQGKASGNYVEISTNLSCGDICIIKIGDKSVKYLLK